LAIDAQQVPINVTPLKMANGGSIADIKKPFYLNKPKGRDQVSSLLMIQQRQSEIDTKQNADLVDHLNQAIKEI